MRVCLSAPSLVGLYMLLLQLLRWVDVLSGVDTAAEHAPEEAYAIFDSAKEKKYTNFEEVRREIERLTDEVAGQ